MYVRDWMTANLVVATPQMSVLYARRLLDPHGLRHLPVVEGERLVGIVSDRDVRLGDPVLAASLAPLQSDIVSDRYRPVAMVMSRPVHTVSPSATLATAVELMRDHSVHALPVADERRLVGILRTSDCLRAVCSCLRPPPDDRSAEPLPSQTLPMPPGDDRPGRPAAKPQALVVNIDNHDRVQIARRFESAGSKVMTCPEQERSARQRSTLTALPASACLPNSTSSSSTQTRRALTCSPPTGSGRPAPSSTFKSDEHDAQSNRRADHGDRRSDRPPRAVPP